MNYQCVKWLDKEQTCSRNASPMIFKKTGFVVKSCFLYTELDCRNDWITADYITIFLCAWYLTNLFITSRNSIFYFKRLNYLVWQNICWDTDLTTRLIRGKNKGFQRLDHVYESCSSNFCIRDWTTFSVFKIYGEGYQEKI